MELIGFIRLATVLFTIFVFTFLNSDLYTYSIPLLICLTEKVSPSLGIEPQVGPIIDKFFDHSAIQPSLIYIL